MLAISTALGAVSGFVGMYLSYHLTSAPAPALCSSPPSPSPPSSPPTGPRGLRPAAGLEPREIRSP
jgi:hypothetical protein